MLRLIKIAVSIVLGVLIVGCEKEEGKEQGRRSSESAASDRKESRKRSLVNDLTVKTSIYSRTDELIAREQQRPARTLLFSAENDSTHVDELCRRIVGADKNALLAIMEEAQGLGSAGMIRVVEAFMAVGDAEVRGKALALLEGFDSTLLVPLAVKALADMDADVRLEALEVARAISDASVLKVYQTALKDTDVSVRIASFVDASSRNDAVYPQILQEAVQSSHGDVALAGLNHMRTPSQTAHIDSIIRCLGHSDATVRDLAHEILYLTFQVDLKAPEKAANWWARKKILFDENLTLKDPATLPLLEAP